MDDNKKTSQLDKMLTIEDIMEHLHISNTTAYKLVEMNSISVIKNWTEMVNSRIRI